MALSNTFTCLRVEGPSTIEGGYVPLQVLDLNDSITFEAGGNLATTTANDYNKYVRVLNGEPAGHVIAYRLIPSKSNTYRWTINSVSKSGNTWTLTPLYWPSVATSGSNPNDPMSSNSGTGDNGGIGTSYSWTNTSDVTQNSVKVYGHTRRVDSLTRKIQADIAGVSSQYNTAQDTRYAALGYPAPTPTLSKSGPVLSKVIDF